MKKEKQPIELHPRCPKCGASTPQMRFGGGHITCQCLRCGFSWTEIPLDAMTDKEKAELA
jgi:uncharacterized Zn finger protein